MDFQGTNISPVAEGEAGETANTDVNQTAEASTAEDVNIPEAASATETTDVNPSEPSTDNGVKEQDPLSLKDRIGSILDKMTGKDQSEDSPPEDSKEKTEEVPVDTPKQDGEVAEEQSVEEQQATDEWRSNPATKKVLNERKVARKERDEWKVKAETSEHEANQHRQVQDFLKTNNVSEQDAAAALKLAALANSDPLAFQQELARMADQWGTHLGTQLPAELQQEVDQGLISPERAMELSRAKGDVRVANQQVQTSDQHAQTANSAAEVQHRNQLYESWSTQKAQTDPHLNDKTQMITDRLTRILQAEGDPKSTDEVWARLDRAHSEVSEELKKFQPAKPAIQPSPKSSGTTRGPVAAPTNFDEAMAQGIDKIMSGA